MTIPLKNASSPKKADSDQAYQSAVGLIAAHAQAKLELAQMQQVIDTTLVATATTISKDHAHLLERIAAVEQQLEILTRQHPEWFAKRKSLVTPCGTVKFTSSCKLEPINAELSIALVEQFQKDSSALYLRQHKELNLDALAALSDPELERLKIRRIKSENFSVTPTKIDLGKTVAAAGKEEA